MDHKSVEKRIIALEEAAGGLTAELPGTSLTRVGMGQNEPHGWSLGIGPINQPKTFFTGQSIEDVLRQAEEAAAKFLANQADRRK